MKDIYCRKIKRNIDVIRTPIDIKVSKHCVCTYPGKVKYLTYFGSLSKVKGVDLIADIASNILVDFKNVIFQFIGMDYGIPGYGSMEKYIYEKVGKASNRVIVHPYLEQKDLLQLVQNSYCCIFPSRVDNYPNSCIEAVALGIPVVVSSGSSIDEMVIDQKTGFVFKNSDSEDLEIKLREVLQLPRDDYLKMRENTNVFYRSILNENRVLQLLNYYQEKIYDFKQTK